MTLNGLSNNLSNESKIMQPGQVLKKGPLTTEEEWQICKYFIARYFKILEGSWFMLEYYPNI